MNLSLLIILGIKTLMNHSILAQSLPKSNQLKLLIVLTFIFKITPSWLSCDAEQVYLKKLILVHLTLIKVKAKQEESARERALCQLTECF